MALKTAHGFILLTTADPKEPPTLWVKGNQIEAIQPLTVVGSAISLHGAHTIVKESYFEILEAITASYKQVTR